MQKFLPLWMWCGSGFLCLSDGLLNQGSLTAMCTFQSIDIVGTRYDYGLGLMRFNILGSQYWAHSGGLFGEYAWYSYCPSNGVCLAVAYNYPNVVAGPNLPSELLIALANYPNAVPATTAGKSSVGISPTNLSLVRIPFLDAKLSTRRSP